MRYDNNDSQRKKCGKILLAFFAGALTATALGGYYFFGPNGRKNYQKTRKWLYVAKADILDRMEDTKNLTEEKYREIVDAVTSKYVAAKEITGEEARKLGEHFKKRWREMHDAARRSKEHVLEEELVDEEEEM